MQSVEKLQNFLPLISFTQWMNEVEYARKIEWDKKKKIILFSDHYMNPYLCLDLKRNYTYIINVTYVRSYVPQVTLCIQPVESLEPSPLHRF